MKSKKSSAFTYIELAAVTTVLLLIVAITTVNVLKSSKIEDKAIIMASKSFYTNAQIAFTEIIRDKAPSGIKYLTSQELTDYFVQYMEGVHLTNSAGVSGDCSSFTGGYVTDFDYINENTRCAKFIPNNIKAGFYVDSECSESIIAKEYAQDDMDSRIVDNACGYIIFESANSKGMLGKDLFIIALGNRRFK